MTLARLGREETRLIQSLVMAHRPSATPIPTDQDRRFNGSSLLKAVRRHRLGPLVLEGARKTGFHLPDEVAAALWNDRTRELAKTAIQLHALDAIADIAVASRRAVLLLKGAWSKTALYPDPSLRPMADVDVLVEPESVPAWCASLEALGYEVRDVAEHATLLAHPARNIYVELHRALTSCERFLGLEVQGLFERSVAAAAYNDAAIRTLSLEDHLLHLTLHAAFQHGMRQAAVNAWDIHLLVARSDLDLSVFLARADRRPMRSYVYGGLCLAEQLFPNARLKRARESLEASQPSRLERRAARLCPERLLSPSNAAVFGSPFGRLAWVESPADGWSLACDILRPREGRGTSAYLARASQLLRNHVVAPLRVSHHPPSALLPSPPKASLEEVPHV